MRCEKAGLLPAPRQIRPSATIRGCARTRRCSDCTGWRGYLRRVRGSFWVLSILGGLELDVPGEWVATMGFWLVDQGLRGTRDLRRFHG